MKDDHVRERRLKLLSMCQALFERVTDSFPFIHSALFGERKLAWKIKRNKCFCHGTNDCGEFHSRVCFDLSFPSVLLDINKSEFWEENFRNSHFRQKYCGAVMWQFSGTAMIHNFLFL